VNGIGAKDLEGHGLRGGAQVDADDVDGEARLQLPQHAAAAAADVENAPNVERVAANGGREAPDIAEQTMDARQLTVDALQFRFGERLTFQQFYLVRSVRQHSV